MKNTFEINGKEYNAVPFTFNTICQLEDMGFSIEGMETKPLSTVRAYFALCVGDMETAGNEMEEHLVAGGDFTDMMEIMSSELEKSGFFKAVVQNTKAPRDHQKPKSTATKSKK